MPTCRTRVLSLIESSALVIVILYFLCGARLSLLTMKLDLRFHASPTSACLCKSPNLFIISHDYSML